MLHVATVHWRDGRWIDPQLRYLRRFTPSGTQVWASLDEIPLTAGSGFDHVMSNEAEGVPEHENPSEAHEWGPIDVGGTLRESLDRREIAWRALTRVNTTDLDPLWFGSTATIASGRWRWRQTARFARVSHRRSTELDRTVRGWIGEDDNIADRFVG